MILFILTHSRVALGFKVKCFVNEYNTIENATICSVYLENKPKVLDRLEFSTHNINTNRITTVDIRDGTNLNDIFDSIPTEVFEIFPNLENFDLASSIKVISSTDFLNATNLKALTLRQANITELKPHVFKELKNLKFFMFGWCWSIRSIERDVFTGLHNLTEIDIVHTAIETIDDGAFDLPNLTTLSITLSRLKLTDPTFCKLPNLQHLYLSFNDLTHLGRSLYCLKNIISINLFDNKINDIDLVEFAKLPRLEYLNLGYSGFTFSATKEAATVEQTSLKYLDLNGINSTNPLDLHQLSIFKGLKYLDLRNIAYTHFDFGKSDIKTVLPNLIELNLCLTEISTSNLTKSRHQLKLKNVEVKMCLP